MFKRLSAIFISLVMCLSLMTPAFAASTTDNATITIQNVEAGSTLTAYQIIEPVIDANGNFVGWKWSSAVEGNTNLANMIKNSTTAVNVEVKSGDTTTTQSYKLIKEGQVSVSNVQAIIAQGASKLGNAANISFSYSSDTKNYTAPGVPVGSYLVYVSPGSNAIKIYNPMVISVDYSGTNSTVNGGVADGSANLTIGDDTAYAKSSPVSIDKTVADLMPDETTQKDYSIGDTINYVITTTVPDYSTDYYVTESLTFSFTDTMDKSLTYNKDLVIQKPAVENPDSEDEEDEGSDGEASDDESSDESSDVVEPTPIPEKNTDGTVNYKLTTSTNAAGQTEITVEFTPEFILANPSQELEITYSAVLNENAATGYNANSNTVVLTYSNTPTSKTTADDHYRVYTFSINGTYLVTSSTTTEQNTYYFQNNFLKTGEEGATPVKDSEGNLVKDTETNRYEYEGVLEGAIFTLYGSDSSGNIDQSNPIQKGLETNEDGYLQVDGLKQGTYYLVETQAPSGYSLNTTPVKIEITATYFANGNLQSYEIKINDVTTESYTLSSDYSDTEPTQLQDQYITLGSGSQPYIFKNVTVSGLPSTGSFGTYAFILIGCVIMATALTLFIVKRKESK